MCVYVCVPSPGYTLDSNGLCAATPAPFPSPTPSGAGNSALGGFNMVIYNSQQACSTEAGGTSILFDSQGSQCQSAAVFANYFVKLNAVAGDTGVTVSSWNDNMCAGSVVSPFFSSTTLNLDGTCRPMPTGSNYYKGIDVVRFSVCS